MVNVEVGLRSVGAVGDVVGAPIVNGEAVNVGFANRIGGAEGDRLGGEIDLVEAGRAGRGRGIGQAIENAGGGVVIEAADIVGGGINVNLVATSVTGSIWLTASVAMLRVP